MQVGGDFFFAGAREQHRIERLLHGAAQLAGVAAHCFQTDDVQSTLISFEQQPGVAFGGAFVPAALTV